MKKLPDNLSAQKDVYRKYIHGAKRRNINFRLSFNNFVKLVKLNCYYCGSSPKNACTHREYYTSVKGNKKIYCNGKPFIYNGLDRKNNKKGYTLGNVVPCCAICNRAKYRLTEEEFFIWIKDIKVYNEAY